MTQKMKLLKRQTFYLRPLTVLIYGYPTNINPLDKEAAVFSCHVVNNIIDDDEVQNHISIPVCFYVKTIIGVQFICYIIISMGRFEADIYLLQEDSRSESS